MRWTNIRLILAREILDQLRDRRTLFMIAVLPLLLYPLLGISLFQLLQFRQEQPTRIKVFGAEQLRGEQGELPTLFDNGHFAERLFDDEASHRLLEVEHAPAPAGTEAAGSDRFHADLARRIRAGDYDAAVHFSPDFVERLNAFRHAVRRQVEQPHGSAALDAPLEIPEPEIIGVANDESRIAVERLQRVLNRWVSDIGKANLEAWGVPASAARPFNVVVADPPEDEAFYDDFWSKVPPVMLLIWALTGAFYPAVDLCAGEKERGTLETLLSSPAARGELVLGKLGTVMLFSIATAVLNLLSVGITGYLALNQLRDIGPPPPLAVLWLGLALIPIAALFSALCLALAAFARSTKEGQYYLMPLLLVTIPLALLPVAPGVELTWGNSLVPVTGLVLLLRTLLEGNYLTALQFAFPVLGVTLVSCWLAVRWAIEQFNSESVLFRESERFDLVLWLRHLVRDRVAAPTAAMALFCGLLVLVAKFYLGLLLTPARMAEITGVFRLPLPDAVAALVLMALLTQLLVVLLPSVGMASLLVRSRRATFLLRRPAGWSLPAAVLLALAIQPLARVVQEWLGRIYPVSDEIQRQLDQVFAAEPSLWLMLLIMALVPALCEELTFRGFVLSGLRSGGRPWRAIVISALFFGLTHAIIAQQMSATLMGLVLGYLAVRTGSLWPGVAFHLVNNGLAIVMAYEGGEVATDGLSLALSGGLSLALLAWFHYQPRRTTPASAAGGSLLSVPPRDSTLRLWNV